MTTLHLNGVALKQHQEPYLFQYDPYAHQLSLQGLIRDDAGFVAINDSPTGGGKTSSWLAPALEERIDTIAIYPTNALVIDQTEQISNELDAVNHEVSVLTVTSNHLADKRSEFGLQSNGAVLDRWFSKVRRSSQQVVLLTNPDIFVMCCRDLYHNPTRSYKRFPLIVVDEFHRAGRKEQNTLRYLLDELYDRDRTKHRLEKIVFLSATPDEKQERRFERAMSAPYHRITEDNENERRPFSHDTDPGWRGVMPPVDLEVRSAPTFGTADELLGDDFEEMITFCRNHSDSGDGDRIAIILDGIHEVARVFEQLDENLERRVERIDGFHSENKKEKLAEFDVLVSNSAVEVGIDFELDRLVFAGHNRASFLQRLGRLRSKTNRCRARCYVPHAIARELEDYHGSNLSRSKLDSVLEDVYPEPRQPNSFGWRYSAPEELRHLDHRLQNMSSDQKESVVRDAEDRIKRHFTDGDNADLVNSDLKRMKDSLNWKVLSKLQWYRGDSIQALVYDRPEETLRTYDLFYLLRYGRVEFFDRRRFGRIVPDEFEADISRKERYVDGFCTYDGTIETTDEGLGRSVSFSGPRLAEWLNEIPVDRNRIPRVINGVKLSVSPRNGQPRVRTLDVLNERLQTRSERSSDNSGGLLCYPVSMRSSLVKERYNLGDFFFLYPVTLQGQTSHSLALGTDALYLHCHVLEEAEQSEGDGGDFIGL